MSPSSCFRPLPRSSPANTQVNIQAPTEGTIWPTSWNRGIPTTPERGLWAYCFKSPSIWFEEEQGRCRQVPTYLATPHCGSCNSVCQETRPSRIARNGVEERPEGFKSVAGSCKNRSKTKTTSSGPDIAQVWDHSHEARRYLPRVSQTWPTHDIIVASAYALVVAAFSPFAL